jgi:hypothetical protein
MVLLVILGVLVVTGLFIVMITITTPSIAHDQDDDDPHMSA